MERINPTDTADLVSSLIFTMIGPTPSTLESLNNIQKPTLSIINKLASLAQISRTFNNI